jgi:hypothetical protein
MYIVLPELDRPPYLGLGFREAEAAQAIFRGLRRKLGMVDSDEKLRVSIITGVDKHNPSHYMIVIGSNLKQSPQSNRFMMVSKMCLMEPPDTRNLDRFLRRYERIGKYLLLPAYFESEDAEPTPYWDLMIGKQELNVRPAWQIGDHDQDACAIWEGREPIIPAGVENAPVLRALRRFEAYRIDRGGDDNGAGEIAAIIESYSEELGTSDLTVVTTLVEYLSKGQPKGHWPCYCAGGKKLRQCHIERLLELRDRISTEVARKQLEVLKSRRSSKASGRINGVE